MKRYIATWTNESGLRAHSVVFGRTLEGATKAASYLLTDKESGKLWSEAVRVSVEEETDAHNIEKLEPIRTKLTTKYLSAMRKSMKEKGLFDDEVSRLAEELQVLGDWV